MDMKELNLEELEKIIGGAKRPRVQSTLPAATVAAILKDAWHMKEVLHYTKEQAVEETASKYRAVQRTELVDLFNTYWDRL